MQKILFLVIALLTITTTIYASFPVTNEEIVLVDSNNQSTETPAADCVDWPLFVICLLFGWLGMHRFMTGDYLIAVIQLLTLGGCGIWYVIDLFAIAMCKMSR